MSNKRTTIIFCVSVLISFTLSCSENNSERTYFETHPEIDYFQLKAGFHNLPNEARMRAWWFWMNGTATKQSITQDLEAMKSHGIAGAILCDNGGDYAPTGPVFMSEEWKDNYAHAIKEADRLGIEISLNIQSGCGDPGNPNIENDNGLKKVTWSEQTVTGPKSIQIEPAIPPNEIFYQDITVQAIKTPEKALRQDDLVKNWGIKTFSKKEQWDRELDRYDLNQFYITYADNSEALAIEKNKVIDLSGSYDNGVLKWDVPEGEWTIIRYGYTSTGKRNNYASAGYAGGLCFDQIHKRGINAQWKDVVKPLIDIAKANSNSLKYVHVDSWEMRTTNWTHDFDAEFRNRRGYDLKPYLPVLAGYMVANREITNRFLEDFRLTVGELAADYNYSEMRRLAHAEGIAMHSESAGPHLPPVDGLKTLGINDIPMGEAWARSTTHRTTEGKRIHVKLGASAAHIYGKRFFAAEIPTSVGPVWERSPADVKNVLDKAFCTGVNRVNWHTYTSSPDEFGLPGVEYFAGTHLNRHVTWWKESKTFIDYINRTQHMLTQGLHVADVLGYLGSGVPLFGFLDSDRGDIPDGYAWDMCNSDVLLNRATVRNGRIYLPDGKNYAMLALPKFNNISLPVLRKIEEMVKQGIILVGNPPERAFGLSGYPDSDREIINIVEKLWGEADGVSSFVHNYGKGKVYAGKTVAEVLTAENILPDLHWEQKENTDLQYIHHTSGAVDVYYVSNKWAWNGIEDMEYRNVAAIPNRYIQTPCTFRVAGERKIERWDPVSGEITSVHVYEKGDGTYTFPVSLEPEGAAFYVFSKNAATEEKEGESEAGKVKLGERDASKAEVEKEKVEIVREGTERMNGGEGGEEVEGVEVEEAKEAEEPNNILRIEKDGTPLTAGNTPFTTGASAVFIRDNGLEVLEKGSYRISYASGEELTVRNDTENETIELPGSWKVTFQEKPILGDPFASTFEELISWTASEVRRIKYFSGTAKYEKRFVIEALDKSSGRAYLNLGKVGDIATIILNGKEVGVYWKPPFIADITDYLVDGENKLEVEVTNLWINRLVGDEQLPEEERKTTTNLRNSTGRYSFERFSKPESDKYLRYSGLMGPVKIERSRVFELSD